VNRWDLIEVSCKYNLPECLENQFQSMKATLRKKERFFDFCNRLKGIDEATFMEILKKVESSNYYGNVEFYSQSLVCTNNGTLLKTFFDRMLQKSNPDFIVGPIEQVMMKNPKGAEIVLDMVIEYYEALEAM
jgi:hypothetical protein